MRKNDSLSSNMEDYLEAVALLKKERGIVRVRDISKLLKVKTSSVTSALSTLSKSKLIIHERYGYVEITPKGEKLAQDIQDRHNILVKFLTKILSINPKIANEDACKIKHTLSTETFQKLTKFIELVETCSDKQEPVG